MTKIDLKLLYLQETGIEFPSLNDDGMTDEQIREYKDWLEEELLFLINTYGIDIEETHDFKNGLDKLKNFLKNS